MNSFLEVFGICHPYAEKGIFSILCQVPGNLEAPFIFPFCHPSCSDFKILIVYCIYIKYAEKKSMPCTTQVQAI